MTTSWPDCPTDTAKQFAQHLLTLYPRNEVRRVVRQHREATAYRRFGERYYDDVTGYLRDCVRCPVSEDGTGFAPYQVEIAEAVYQHGRAAARGPRGFGKTAIAANVLLHFALTRDALGINWRVVTTASVWRQLTEFLWPEVRLWAKRINWGLVGRGIFSDHNELMLMSLRLRHGHAMPIASREEDTETAEGAHADELLYIFDESKLIPSRMWDSAEGAFSTGKGYWLAVSTPGAPAGRFYQIMARQPGYEKWWTRKVTALEAVEAGRISQAWIDERKAWGEDSVLYRQHVLGDFAADTEGSVIPLAWIEAANQRWIEWDAAERKGRVTHIGFDVGGGMGGGDRSTIAVIYEGGVVGDLLKIEQAIDPSRATMELAGQVAMLCQKHKPRFVVGDVIGLGAGVVQRLREMGIDAIGFTAGAATGLTDASGLQGFANWRAAGWLTLRDALEPQKGLGLALPPDDDLIGELSAPRVKSVSSLGKVLIEGKEEIRKRIGRSTDCADAVIHALVGPLLAREQQAPRREVVWRGAR